METVNAYEKASGENVKFDELEVLFSKGIEMEREDELVDLLHIKRVEKLAKYLGAPTILGRSKKRHLEL